MELIKKILFICLFTIPLFNGYNFSYLLILWNVFIIYNAIRTKSIHFSKIGISLLTIFIVSFVSLFFANDLKLSTSIVQSQLSIFIFGLSSILYKFEKKEISFGFKVYVFSSLLSVLFSFYYFDVFTLIKQINSTNTFNNFFRDGIQFMPFFGKHPIYFALISVISVFISVTILVENNKSIYRILNALNILVQIVFLVLLAAKMALLLLILGVFVVGLGYFKEVRNKFIFLISIFCCILILFQLPIIKTRFLEYKNYGKYQYPYKEYYNSISIRNALNKCSFEIAKEHYLMGVGVGNDILLMKNCLSASFDSTFDDKETYNEHNQIIAFLLRYGIIGIVLFIAPFYLSLWKIKSLKNNNLFVITFTIGISMLTENILDRSVGAYVFSFFMFLNSQYE